MVKLPKWPFWIAPFLLVALFVSPAYAQSDESAKLRYSLWTSELQAKIQVDAGLTIGDEFSINDLGMDKKENIDVWELIAWQGSLRLDISYWEHAWEGGVYLNRRIVYEGLTFNPGDPVDSTLKMKAFDAALTTSLVTTYKSSFSAVFGLKYIEYSTKFWRADNNWSASEQAIAPVPYMGISTAFMLQDQMLLCGRFVMSQYSYSGTNVDVGNFYQIDAYVELRAGTSLAMQIGIHTMQLTYKNKTEGDEFEIRQMLRGPYVAFYLSF